MAHATGYGPPGRSSPLSSSRRWLIRLPMRVLGAVCLFVWAAACGDPGRSHAPSGEPEPPDVPGTSLGDPKEEVGTIFVHTGEALYTVDPVTFDLKVIGGFGIDKAMTDIAVALDGTLYGVSMTSLYTIDRKTGLATMKQANVSSTNVALTFQTDGTLLASDTTGAVRTIDPVSGTIVEIGTYGAGFDTAGDLVAVADGTMFGISSKGPGTTKTSNVLLTVDPKTGVAQGVGPIGYDEVFGIAYSRGNVLAFTRAGEIIKIDPKTGAGTVVRVYPKEEFFGAGTSPLVPIL